MDHLLELFVVLLISTTDCLTGEGLWAQLDFCGKCHPDQCVMELRCPAGQVRDRCGCCWECGGDEGQLCDQDPSGSHYGHCGEGLICQILEQDLLTGEVPESQCVCVQRGVLCGSDGRTYETACQLRTAQHRQRLEGKMAVTVAHQGPCKAKPTIATPPQDLITVAGSDIIFSCEVSAYPMAMIEWRKEGNSIFLPADDSHMSVQARGGPRRFELTGWLQIENVRQADEGVYTCTARNEFGEVLAPARLQVVQKDSEWAQQLKQQNTAVSDDSDEYEEGEGDYKLLASGHLY